MKSSFIAWGRLLGVLCLLLALAACGDDQDNDLPAAVVDSQVSGVAATGAAFSGAQITVTGTGGNSVSTVAAGDGTYSAVVTGLAPPYLIKASKDAKSLYSHATAAGIANITQLTTLSLRLAYGTANLESLFQQWSTQNGSISAQGLSAAREAILANFASQLQAQGLVPGDIDLFTTPFVADGTGFDAVLDNVQITFDFTTGDFSVTGPQGTPIPFDPDLTLGNTGGNSAPVADAGPNQGVTTGSQVILDGSGSSDANGDALAYSWALTAKPAGSNATLANATTVNPTFTADLDGAYVLTLVVNDGQTDSTADTVTITAATGGGTTACGDNAGDAPATYAALEGDYRLAISSTSNTDFPLGSQRTENIFRVCRDGSITILDSDGTTQLKRGQWDNDNDVTIDAWYGRSLVINTGSEQVRLNANPEGTTIDGSYVADTQVAGGGSTLWANDPGLRGTAPPQELINVAGTFQMEKLDILGNRTGELYDVSITTDGTVTAGPAGVAGNQITWSGVHDRVDVYAADPQHYQVQIKSDGGSQLPYIQVIYDAASDGVVRVNMFGFPNDNVSLLGLTIGGAGSFGTAELSSSSLDGTIDPGRPTVNIYNWKACDLIWESFTYGDRSYKVSASYTDKAAGDEISVTLKWVTYDAAGKKTGETMTFLNKWGAACVVGTGKCQNIDIDLAAGTATMTGLTFENGATLSGTLTFPPVSFD